jgi:outer membrane protein assembly factor BamB
MFGHDLERQSHSLSSAPSDNKVKWSYNTTSEVVTAPAIADDYAIVACIDGEVIAFNATTGAKLWTYYIEGSTNLVWSSPAIDSGRVYVGARNNDFYCLNQSTGGLLWSYATGGPILSSPLVKESRVFFSSNDGEFYCLNSVDGSLMWTYTYTDTATVEASSPAVIDDIIVFGSVNSNVYALNTSNGDEIWIYPAGSPISSSPAINDGRVYFGSDDAMVCLNTYLGSLIWNTTIEGGGIWGGGIYLSSPAVANGRVFIGSVNENIYSFNATTGTSIWEYPTDGEVWSSPAVADGKVFIGSSDGRIYCLNETTGDVVWSQYTLDRVVSSPAIAGGTVFVGCGGTFVGGRICAFGPDYVLPTTITLSLDMTTTYLTFKVTLSGQLKSNGAGIDGASVLLSYSVDGGQTWDAIITATTSNDGMYSAEWVPATTSGTFMVKASWEGDYPFLGHEAVKMLSITPYQDKQMFSVASNSTLSELSFDSTKWELSFTATGELGTKGYSKVATAKNLVPKIDDVKVYLNGNKLDYTVESVSGSWFLNFVYAHNATHSVVVRLREVDGGTPEPNGGDGPEPNGGIPEIVFLLIAVLAATSVVGALVYYRHRKRSKQTNIENIQNP